MEALGPVVRLLVPVALALAGLQAYLQLNKLWVRKHERVAAESVSVLGETIGLVPIAVLTLVFLQRGSWPGLLVGALWIAAAVATLAVGSGRWVDGTRGGALRARIRQAVRLEWQEVATLALTPFRPSGARAVMEIMGQVAMLDDHLDRRERAFIQSFAVEWGIPVRWEEVEGRHRGGLDLEALRDGVVRYLRTSPPPAQVKQLGDVIRALVAIDDRLSPEEELMVAELDGMFRDYAGEEDSAPTWGVALVPQEPGQERAIRRLLPEAEKRDLEGGTAYVVGPFHSRRYAETVSEEYRSLKIFTTLVHLSGGPKTP